MTFMYFTYTVSRPHWEDVLFSSFCILRIMECNYTTNGKMQKLENETSVPVWSGHGVEHPIQKI